MARVVKSRGLRGRSRGRRQRLFGIPRGAEAGEERGNLEFAGDAEVRVFGWRGEELARTIGE